MAKTNIEELVVKMSADLASYHKTMLKAEGVANRTASKIVRDFNGMNQGVSRSLGSTAGAFKSFGLGMVAAFSFEKISSAAIQAVKDIAEIGDTAESIGISAEALQALQHMAVASGTDVDTLRKGLQSLAEQAVESGSALDKLFAVNGFDVKSMNMDQIIEAFATMVQNAATAKDQLSIITGVMGDKVGRELVEAFRTGADGQREAYNQMLKDSDYHTNEEVKRIQAIEEAYNRVTERIQIRWQQMIVGLVHAYDSFTQAVNDTVLKPGLGIQDKPNFDLGPGMGSFTVPNPYYKRPTVSDNPNGTAPVWKPSDDKPTVNPKTIEDAANATNKLAGKQKWLNETWKAGKPEAIALGAAQDAQVQAYNRVQTEIGNYIAGLQEERQALELEIQTFGMSLDQKARAEAVAKIPVAASEAQRQAALAEADAIAALTAQYEQLQQQQEVAQEIHDVMKSAFVGFAQDVAHGANVLKSLENALGKVADKLLEMAAENLFENVFGSLFGASGGSGGSGGGSLFGSLLGSIFTGLFSGGVGLYHNGGVAGQMNGGRRNVHPALFAGAERYHSGGIAGLKPGEVPAILKRGEIVIPRGGASGGGRTVTVVNHFHGVAGNSEIRRIAQQATRDGIRGYAKARHQADLERQLRME